MTPTPAQPRQPKALPSKAVTVAPGARAIILTLPYADTYQRRVFLRRLGIAIDPSTNANFATFRLLVNGVPFPGFNALQSQVGDITNPTPFDDLPLADNAEVSIEGEMAAGAVGNTQMAATAHFSLEPL